MSVLAPAGVLLHDRYLTCHRADAGWMIYPKGVSSLKLPSVYDSRAVDEHPCEDKVPCMTPYSADISATRVLAEVKNLNPSCQVKLSATTFHD